MNRIFFASVLFAISTLSSFATFSKDNEDNAVSKGRYLVAIGGCNDCHTPGYASSGAATPEAEWLLGDSLGYRGAWGTTYPTNLREYVGQYTESEWVAKAKSLKTRPPMPWWALNAMNEDDLSSLYKYIKSLGVINTTIPAFVPPGVEPKQPFIQWPMPPIK